MTSVPLLPALLLLFLAGCAIPARLGAGGRDRVAGRTYVVTGASSGLGRGVALRLASHGANTVPAARRTAVLDEVAQQVRAAGGQALAVTTDTSDPGQMARLQGAALQRLAASTCGSTTPPWPPSARSTPCRCETTAGSST